MNIKYLTIVVPSFNHEKYIIECLESIKKIEDCNFIIVDDGSTDRTPQLINQFIIENSLSDWKFIQKKNEGLISSLNLALNFIETEYVYFCASDDVPNSIGVNESLRVLKNSSANFIIAGGINFFENKKNTTPVYSKIHDVFFKQSFEKRQKEIFLNYPSPILIQTAIFRTAILRGIGGWDMDLKWDDYPIFVKLFKISKEFGADFLYRNDICIVGYRHHGNNTYKNAFDQFLMVIAALNKLAENDVKEKSIKNKAAFYCLLSLKNRDFTCFMKILKLFEYSERLKIFFGMTSIVFKKINKKI